MKYKLLVLTTFIIFIFGGICFATIENTIEQVESDLNQILYINENEQEPERTEIGAEEKSNYDLRDKGKGLHLLGVCHGLTYYSQADNRWANVPYTSIGDLNQTMKSSGCGPTVCAMVVSSSKGAILPTTMADIFVKNGFRTPSNGTAWSAFPFIANYFDFKSYYNTSNIDTALDYLRKGYYVVASCGNGLFTTNGHYIFLTGIDGNTLKIYDSYLYNGKFDTASRKGKVTVQGNTIYCTISNFKKYANYRTFWCFSNDYEGGNTNGSQNNTQSTAQSTSKKYTTGRYKTTANLHVRYGPSTSYKFKYYNQLTSNARKQNKQLGNYYYNGYKKGVVCDVTKVSGNWGLTKSGWICLDYCKKY